MPLSETDSVFQANALAPGWGQTIFQSANEINANTILRKRLDEIQAQTESEKQWWEKRRAQIQKEFMSELDRGEKAVSKAPSAVSEDEPVLVDQSTPSATPSAGKKKKGKK
jgi:translocation protein SEC66